MIKNIPIQIGVKIKPKPTNCPSIASVSQNYKHLTLTAQNNQKHQFNVNKIYDASNNSSTPFQHLGVCKLMDQLIEGYNVSVLAYGQTGAGKTYLMQGTSDGKVLGLIQQSLKYIGEKIPTSTITCTYVQIYNEKIFDLINSNPEKSYKLKWETDNMFTVDGLKQTQCHNSTRMIELINLAIKNRINNSTKNNQLSSRSHSIFTLTVEDTDEDGNIRKRHGIFVDLAGSERVSSHNGKIQKESIQINKSLFWLRKVITTLSDMSQNNKQLYIGYRESKLTSLLKRCFGGDCQSMLIACIQNNEKCLQQTISTLQYALSAGNIKNYVSVQIDRKEKEIKHLKAKNIQLQRQVQLISQQLQISNQMKSKALQNHEYSNRIIQCISTVRQLLESNKVLREQLDAERAISKHIKQELQQTKKQNKLLRRLSNKIIQQQNSPIKDRSKLFQKLNEKIKKQKTVQSVSLQKHHKINPQEIVTYENSKSIQRFRSKTRFRKSLKRAKDYKYILTQPLDYYGEEIRESNKV